MAQWSRVLQLIRDSKIQMPPLYGEFPIEIRDCLAEWLESVPWNEFGENDPTHREFAIEYTNDMIKRIEDKERGLAQNEFLKKLKLFQTAENFKVTYGKYPFNLAHVITKMLAVEKTLIEASAEGDIKFIAEQGKPLLEQTKKGK